MATIPDWIKNLGKPFSEPVTSKMVVPKPTKTIKTNFNGVEDAAKYNHPPYSAEQIAAANKYIFANTTGPSGENTVETAPTPVVDNTPTASAPDPSVAYYAKIEAEKAAEKAASDERKKGFRSDAGKTIDSLLGIYSELVGQINQLGGTRLKRITDDFNSKITEQLGLLDDAKYSVDANAAASGLADSSYRSVDRQKVKDASDANVKTLNTAREDSEAALGSKISSDVAKYQGASNILRDTTKPLLEKTENEGELLQTLGSLGSEKETAIAAQAGYKPDSTYVEEINKIGNAGSVPLDNILASISSNTNASSATKTSTMTGIIDGSNIDEEYKQLLRNKYIQTGA